MNLAVRAVGLLLLIVLSGCNDEPAQRQAFIEFLQKHIVTRPGVHIVLMNEELAKSFGPYASQYQIILDFNSNVELSALERVTKFKNEVSDLVGLAAHRAEFKTLREAISEMIAIVDRDLLAADAAHASLQQPPNLKEVYDKAFDRLVTRPGALFARMLRLWEKDIGAVVALADYVAANSNEIRVVGMDGTSRDPVVDAHLRELLETVHQNDAAVADLKRQLQALTSGT